MSVTRPASANPGPTAAVGPEQPPSDIRRWVTLGIVLMSTLIIVLDNTVLSVAIPTILAEFHTTLPSLEWVITGYSLTFATFLIIGGRLGDVHGQRRMFIIGAALFTAGSLLASLSWNVASLVVGEAIIEGVGASLMLPATLALLSNTFQGREPGHGVRGLGSRRRIGRRAGTRRRWSADDQLLVALGVSDQRHHRSARDHRCAVVHRQESAEVAA